MAKQAPEPKDALDFQFKLHCRLKVFANEDNSVFDKACSLVAVASRFGLVFVGTKSPAFQVIRTSEIEKHPLSRGEVSDYSRRTVQLPTPPRHLSVNCDGTKLAVVVEKNGCCTGIIYDVPSFMKQEVSIVTEIRLSPSPGVHVVDTSWNPTIPDIFTACKSDGTLGLYEFKATGIDINELPVDSQATCMCWSPKGKQIAVGSRDGRITQYKPDLKAMKVVSPPPLQGPQSMISLQWISNYQFVTIFQSLEPNGVASLLVVDSPKTGETVYTNYEDVCFSNGNVRPTQFYTIFQSVWNVLMVASSNSMEVGVMVNENEQWTQWVLADSARAELPMSTSKPKYETLPVGLQLDISSMEPVPWGETELPAAPFLLLLSHDGLLCCFKTINSKSASICQEPEKFKDVGGLSCFTTVNPDIIERRPPIEVSNISMTAPVPIKPVVASAQAMFPFLSTVATTAVPTNNSFFTKTPSSIFEATSFTPPKTASVPLAQPMPTMNLFGTASTVVTKPLAIKTTASGAAMVAAPVAVTSTASVPSVHLSEPSVVQEEADLLISKLIREECEMLEAELKVLLHKARGVQIDLGSDAEAVELVHETDSLEDFLKEATETSAGQAAEVHSLKQALIQAWAWYEDARSRFTQTQDAALGALLRIQQLDPVSQRYSASIKHITYYLESQLVQAEKVLDEQWENFQDSCKKVMRLKIPTMEAIYQTMVRQSAVHQKQKYVLRDISSRIRAHRSRVNGPSLLVSLDNADNLERELRKLQLEPEHLLRAQYERVYQNQKRLTKSKVKKLRDLLVNREITEIPVSKPQLSTTSLQSSCASPDTRALIKDVSKSATLLGTALSPIASNKAVTARVVDFTQSTPKLSVVEQAVVQNHAQVAVSSEADLLKKLPPGISIKFTPSTTITSMFGQPTFTAVKPVAAATVPQSAAKFQFTTVPPMSSFVSIALPVVTSTPAVTTIASHQLNFNFSQTKTTSSVTAPVTTATIQGGPLFLITPTSQMKPAAEQNQAIFTISPAAVSVAAAASQPTIKTGNENAQFNFGDPAKPPVSFASFFNVSKSNSAFSFSGTTASTGSAVTVTKPLVNTTSSAFVPTTQLSFSFSTKSGGTAATSTVASTTATVTTTTPSAGGGFALTKSSTFNFGTAAFTFSSGNTTSSESPTPTAAIASPALFSVLKSAPAASATITAASAAPAPIQNLFKAVSVAEATTTAVTAFSGLVTPKPILTAPSSSSGTAAKIASQAATAPADVAVTTTTAQSLQYGFIAKPASVPSTSVELSSSMAGAALVTASTKAEENTSVSVFNDKTANTTATAASVGGSVFGTSIFGGATTASSGFIFGATSVTAGPIFGSAPDQGSPSTTTAAPAFSMFSTAVATTTATTPTAVGAIAATTSASIFSPAPTKAVFDAAPMTTATVANTAATVFSPTTAATIFGAPTAASVPLFGGPVPTAAVTVTTPVFGSPAMVTTTASVFGSGSIPAATTASSIFGATPASSAPLFGTPSATPSVFSTTSSVFGGAPSAAAGSVFGATAKTAANAPFGSPPFGSGGTNSTGSVFNSNSTFGQTTTTTPGSSSIFGQPLPFGSSGESVFGSSVPVSSSGNTFGGNNTGSNFALGSGGGGSVFGSPSGAPSGFVQASSSFSFAAAAANIPSPDATPFGFSKPSSPFGFGSMATGTDSASSFSFNNLNMGAAAAANNKSSTALFGSGFGQSPSAVNPFAKTTLTQDQQKPPFGSLFGAPATSSPSVFGSGSTSAFGGSTFGSPPGFGSPSTFGQQQQQPGVAAFGQSSFGSPSQPGPFSGGNQSVAQTGFGGFDNSQGQKQGAFSGAPVFGGSPGVFGARSVFGSSPTAAFGSSPTFGSPSKVFGDPNASAGATAFGPGAAAQQQQSSTFANLATQNTLGFSSLAAVQQQQQPMSGFSSGGSSFSTWR